MDAQDLANSLFGASRMEETTLNTMSTLQGVAVADSEDGYVKVKIAGESIPEDADATEPNTVVELPTTPCVKEGDTVTITAEGGALKSMTVTGNIGRGDYDKQLTDDASKVASDFIQLTDDNNIVIGNLSQEVAQNDLSETNIIFECTGTVSQNDVAFSKEDHIHAGLFVKQEISNSFEIYADTKTQIEIALPTVEGYEALAIAGLKTDHVHAIPVTWEIKDSVVRIILSNPSESAVTGTFTATLLYIKDGWA